MLCRGSGLVWCTQHQHGGQGWDVFPKIAPNVYKKIWNVWQLPLYSTHY